MRQEKNGFTLIEALVALTIIAVALMACLKAAANMNAQQDEMLKRQYAQWSARHVADWISVAGVYPAVQRFQKTCNQAKYQFTCWVDITNTPNPNFRRVEVAVKDRSQAEGDEHQLARLVLFVSSAP